MPRACTLGAVAWAGPWVKRPAPSAHLDGVGRVVVAVDVVDRDIRAVHGAVAVGLAFALQLVLGEEGVCGDPWSLLGSPSVPASQ